MTTVEAYTQRPRDRQDTETAYLVFDCESVPDGDLIARVKYPGEPMTPEAAIDRAQAEAKETSYTGSDFLPVSFQVPVAVCVARVGRDYKLRAITCLDSPQFRQREVVRRFWAGLGSVYANARLVSFNGRGFDVPLLELAAFRYGLSTGNHFTRNRDRYRGQHHDLLELMTNFGGCRLAGGLNLLSKMIGKPGKIEVAGDQVLSMYRAGQLQAINDYCMFDVLDTYFVFLRTRVMMGELSSEDEADCVTHARRLLEHMTGETPVLRTYLANWAA